jgi:hypothetical protein
LGRRWVGSEARKRDGGGVASVVGGGQC